MVCDTFLRCKGLERLAVIITVLRNDSEKHVTRMYIAISRTVGVLRIIGGKKEIEMDKTLAPLADRL